MTIYPQRMGRPRKTQGSNESTNKNTQNPSNDPYSNVWNLNNTVNDVNMSSEPNTRISHSLPSPPRSCGRCDSLFNSTSEIVDGFDFSVSDQIVDSFTPLDQILDLNGPTAKRSTNANSTTAFAPSPDTFSISNSPIAGVDSFGDTSFLNSDGSWESNLDDNNTRDASSSLDSSNLGTITSRKDAVQELSILSSRVLKNLSQFSTGRRDGGTENSSYRIPDSSISDMFQNSETLLEILKNSIKTTQGTRSSLSGDTGGSKNNGENGSTGPEQPNPASELRAKACHPELDITTKIAALTCLACLIRVYEHVFSQIHESLVSSSPFSDESLPPLPCLQLGNFEFSKDRSLHLHVVAHVSSYLVGQIKDSLEAVGLDSGEEHVSAGLFDVVLGNQTGGEGEGNGKARLQMLKQTIEEVMRLSVAVVPL